ncbi:MAG: anhydro-N-acetylmuramic acid kinase, partial [Pseudomonadota bacterium]
DYGVHPDWVEAIAFAWLAKQTIENKPGNLPAVTGAKEAVVLGAIYF